MAKQFFKKWLPHPTTIKNNKNLQFLGNLLHDPNLWHLNKRSVSGGMAVGLCMAFIPVPMQMLFAAILAILFRVNLALSVSLVWITNPFTIPPIFYFAYKVGAFLLGITPQHLDASFTMEWLFKVLDQIWQPFLLGCCVFSCLGAIMGYFFVRILWSTQIRRSWNERRIKRLTALNKLKKHNLSVE
jgi:hypothetical protein